MNDNHETGSGDNEAVAREALEPLRAWDGPDGDSSQRRADVTARLATAIQREQDLRDMAKVPLWRRRVTVPMPVAAAFLVAFIALSALAIGDRGKPGSNVEQATVSKQQDVLQIPSKDLDVRDSPPAQGTQPAVVAATDCQIQYREERIVVAGLGTIKSVQSYQCESE